MGLINKLKNILFEEEEVEIPVIEKKEKKPEPVVQEPKVEVKPTYSNRFYDDLGPTINEEKKIEEQNREVKKPVYQETVVKQAPEQSYKSERAFNFPAFDEEEFEREKPKVPIRQQVVESKKIPKRVYKAPEIPKKDDTTEKKFRPSPIISPVYGILDKNYTPDEITSRPTSDNARKLDVESVRKKAFGDKQKKENIIPNHENGEDIVLKEKLEKARTIDELLKDSSDEVITLHDEPLVLEDIVDEEEPKDEEILEKAYEDEENEPISLDAIEDKKEENTEDDTLESDLFDLIDSMYENREGGE